MGRFLAGFLACMFLMTGGILLWQGNAAGPQMADAPEARLPAQEMAAQSAPIFLDPIGEAPEADPKSKEEKRFDRADKNDDGRITLAELVEPRRKPFAKLDLDQNGQLSFEEWAIRTIDKFEKANANGDAHLTRAEYATTKAKTRPKKPRLQLQQLSGPALAKQARSPSATRLGRRAPGRYSASCAQPWECACPPTEASNRN